MVAASCPNCQASFHLKDEYAGKKAKCPNCQTVFPVPELSGSEETVAETAVTSPSVSAAYGKGIFKNHVYGVKQKKMAVNEKYYIRNQDNADIFFSIRRIYFWKRMGAILVGVLVFGIVLLGLSATLKANASELQIIVAILAAIAAAVALSPKRHIEFFFSEGDVEAKQPEFVVSQDGKLEFPTQHFTLRDASGNTVAKFRKNVFTDIFRKTWHMEYSGKHVVVREDSVILGLLRRWMPFGQLIRTNFIFQDVTNGSKPTDILGYFKRKFELFDNYSLDMTNDPTYSVPRQLALCMAILLDTGERR
jgi:predicted Zn finger-like uncharacterized protein